MTLREVWRSTTARQQDMPLAIAVTGSPARVLAATWGEDVIEDERGKRSYYVINAGAPKHGYPYSLRRVWECSAEEEKDMRVGVQPLVGDCVLICSHGVYSLPDGTLCLMLLGGIEKAS